MSDCVESQRKRCVFKRDLKTDAAQRQISKAQSSKFLFSFGQSSTNDQRDAGRTGDTGDRPLRPLYVNKRVLK